MATAAKKKFTRFIGALGFMICEMLCRVYLCLFAKSIGERRWGFPA